MVFLRRSIVRKVLIFLIALLPVLSVEAQINTEKYRKYYEKEGFLFNASTTLALKDGNTEYIALKGTGRIDYNGKAFDYFVVGNFEYKSSSDEKIENQGFLHLRSMWNFAPRADLEVFAQRQYDEFIDLNARNLAGTGIKYGLVRACSRKDSTHTFDVNLSVGIMYETEEYDVDERIVSLYLWRSTNFVSFDWLLKEKLNLTGVVYYQPALKDFGDYRLSVEAGLEIQIAKRLFLITSFTYRYISRPIAKVKNFDLSLENGIRFQFN
ncbi:DUF481 domain-containing protein [Candidatus Falkowbacteria bacterium]|jgi:putative salt-induced outer membrane protein YdiY|nr:DUF481 domain-containing protein [Candidatus Falkowbacteria bacterium]